jgi:response regulator RpfG family c-di-GMP phosphodiesterase
MAAETKKNKLLFVDDIPTNIKVLLEVLKDDYKIIFAQNGAEAVKLAVKSQPDLILLDIMMPDMDGYAVCKKLKNNPETSDIPIIFATALDEEEDETKGFDLGAVDYITKPFSLPIVKARIKTHLELKLRRDQLRQQAEELAAANERLQEEIIERKNVEEMIRDHISFLHDLIKTNSFPSAVQAAELSHNEKEF